MQPAEGIILVDKPVGITSFDVIRRLRYEVKSPTCRAWLLRAVQGASEACEKVVSPITMQERTSEATQKCAKSKVRMGHAGTLDPLASGLMLIGVGAGTKQLTQYVRLDKEYVAEIRIGEQRTTGDLAGEIVASVDVFELARTDVDRALQSLVGELSLPVSAFSALKKDGVPMYKRAHAAARKGETVPDIPERAMKVYEAELLSLDIIDDIKKGVATVRFSVGSGTYVRSLAEELGRRLGYPATLQALRRTKVGEFRVEDAESV